VTLAAPSSVRGRVLFGASLIGAHVAPAAAVWAALGALLALVPQLVAVIAVVVYAMLHGLAETLDLRLDAPGINWQVPSSWLRGRRLAAHVAIWGTTLGPGLVTRNPYAGMWFILFALAAVDRPELGAVIGAIVGVVHGTARALGILANHADRYSPELPWRMMITQMRVRLADGIGLLAAAGAIVAAFRA
jgi:hypothetical protein